MSETFENDLWDKPNAIISFNDSNTLILERFQKFVGEICKIQSLNLINQKRCFDKFLVENEDLKKSDFTFNTCSYYLSERILEILNIQDTFNEVLLKEVDEIIKDKLVNIKKDTKQWKIDKKRCMDDLAKENQKHDYEFKRYCNRFAMKETAYNAYLKAEQNKSLSRNQVDNYHMAYNNRKSDYDQTKQDYSIVLDNFNKYHANHYFSILPEWSRKGEEIEINRYGILKSTFTNFSELCRSLASKYGEIADRIELESETINCRKDCLTLINKEKTGDIPPGPISFKDFDVEPNNEIPVPEIRPPKVPSSSSDSNSITNGKPKISVNDVKIRTNSIDNGNQALSTSCNSNTSNGSVTGGSKIFSKLFGGIKKTKSSFSNSLSRLDLHIMRQDMSNKAAQTEIEKLEELLESKLAEHPTYEFNEELDKEVDSIKNQLESLKAVVMDSSQRKSSVFRSVRQSFRNKSIDHSTDTSKDKSIMGKLNLRNCREETKRRSQSVSSIHRSSSEMSSNCNSDEQPEFLELSMTSGLKPKTKSKPFFTSQMRAKPSKERKETPSVYSRSIEVIRNTGPVEIVATPADAMASHSRASSTYGTSEYELLEMKCDNKFSQSLPVSRQVDDSETYQYYYIGSCVAIHEYTSIDPSDIYLSFSAGEQFYIIQEDAELSSNGWLLVERIDRSSFGYVPESYMDTRNFDDPVLMYSNHPMIAS